MGSRSELLKSQLEAQQCLEELARIDREAVTAASFEDSYRGCDVKVTIRREAKRLPWKISVGLVRPGKRQRRIDVIVPAADTVGFKRSSDAFARGFQLARRAIDDNLLGIG